MAVVVSLCVNGLLLASVREGWTLSAHPAAQEVRPVALTALPAERWAANRQAQRPASAKAAERPAKPEARPVPPRDDVRPPGQVVDIGAANDKAPAESRFVSERNNTVEKETRSRHARPGYERALPVPSAPSARQAAAPDGEGGAGGEGGQGVARAEAAAETTKRPPRDAAREDAARKEASDGRGEEPDAARGELLAMGPGALERAEPGAPPAPSGEPGPDGTPSLRRPGAPGRPGVKNPALSPSASFYEGLAGGPAPDHLDGVEEGEATWLNTREWKYAGYFNRIKQAVADQWDPNRALALRDPTGEMFAYKDRITFVEVTLDDHGALKDVTVQKTSGVEFLDRTALDAFRKAQPFVNPPRGLANEQGEIKFTFGFYLQVGTTGMRVFRQPAAR